MKQWLFGGQQIATGHALFKLADYTGQIIEDLFGEDSYFADADLFWALQNRAIATKRDSLLKAGWSAVEILEVGQRFQQYEHVKVSKKHGGKVVIAASHDGAVEIFDGWLTPKEAKKLAKATPKDAADTDDAPRASGPQMTQALANYVALHRHAAVRQAVIGDPGIALRLAVAHALAPSGNWTVRPDPQTTRNPAIRASLDASPAQAAFTAEQHAVFALLGWAADDDIARTRADTLEVFAAFCGRSDAEVLRVAAFAMAQSLQAGSDVVDAMGERLAVDLRSTWTPDDTFFDLIRDRATVNALLAEVAGAAVATANVAEKAKTQKQVIRDCLAGAHGRQKVGDWLPGWFAFPVRSVEAEGLPDNPDSQPVPIAAE